MAVFAKTLADPNSLGGRQCELAYLEDQPVRFFLCGSLHGGTGACGVPVMAKFLGDYKSRSLGWIGNSAVVCSRPTLRRPTRPSSSCRTPNGRPPARPICARRDD